MDKFRLDDWNIHFEFGNIEHDAMAQASIKTYGRVVTFAYSSELTELAKQEPIKSVARHEVCHVLIAELDALIGTYCTSDENKLANEKLTVKLCNLLKDK